MHTARKDRRKSHERALAIHLAVGCRDRVRRQRADRGQRGMCRRPRGRRGVASPFPPPAPRGAPGRARGRRRVAGSRPCGPAAGHRLDRPRPAGGDRPASLGIVAGRRSGAPARRERGSRGRHGAGRAAGDRASVPLGMDAVRLCAGGGGVARRRGVGRPPFGPGSGMRRPVLPDVHGGERRCSAGGGGSRGGGRRAEEAASCGALPRPRRRWSRACGGR